MTKSFFKLNGNAIEPHAAQRQYALSLSLRSKRSTVRVIRIPNRYSTILRRQQIGAKMEIDILEHNRRAWDKEVERGNQWTVPVSPDQIEDARRGIFKILLTPTIPVPMEWFPSLSNCDVLCLASGGGQQGPLLAAAGANVTVLDNSTKQLAQDAFVASRDSLEIKTVEGDMANLHMFGDASFDLIVHPVSNTFVPDVKPVWREAHRVLRPGATLLAGFTNPLLYLFDQDLLDREGILEVMHSIPYSDIEALPEEKLSQYIEQKIPLEFSHTLDDQIGGQIAAGFLISGFFEDRFAEVEEDLLSNLAPLFIATMALKSRSA
jgi:SAM-dependent methyltransferase